MKNTGNRWWLSALIALGLLGAIWGLHACGSSSSGGGGTTHSITLKGATS